MKSHLRPGLLALVLLPLLLGTTAHAASELTLSSVEGPPTSRFTVSGSGFPNRQSVDLLWDGVKFASVKARKGAFEVGTQVPANAAPGSHTVEARDVTGASVRTLFLVRTNWTQFGFGPGLGRNNRFENQLGVREATSLVEQWRFSTRGAVSSSPVYAFGNLFVTSTDGYLYAHDVATRRSLWRLFLGKGLAATPVVMGSDLDPGSKVGFNPQPEPPRVLIGTSQGVASVDPRTGVSQWFASVGPVVVNPLVLKGFNPQPEPPRILVAIDSGAVAALSSAGQVLWTTKLGATPAAALSAYSNEPMGTAQDRVMLGTTNGDLFQLNAQTGAVLWRQSLGAVPGPVAISEPQADGERVAVVGDGAGTVHALRVRDGRRLWTYGTSGPITTAPALGDSSKGEAKILVTSGDGMVYGFRSLKNNTLLWFAKLGPALGSDPAMANGVAYFGAADGRLRAVDATNGNLLFVSTAVGITTSSPIVADGWLFFGTDKGAVVAWQ